MIGVERRVKLRHEGLAEGVVERLLDGRNVDAEPRCGVAIDVDRRLRTTGLLVVRDVLQAFQQLQLGDTPISAGLSSMTSRRCGPRQIGIEILKAGLQLIVINPLGPPAELAAL